MKQTELIPFALPQLTQINKIDNNEFASMKGFSKSTMFESFHCFEKDLFVSYKTNRTGVDSDAVLDAIEYKDISAFKVGDFGGISNKPVSEITKLVSLKASTVLDIVKGSFDKHKVSLGRMKKEALEQITLALEESNNYSKQLFSLPESFLLLTSTELIEIKKTRPLDKLFLLLNNSTTSAEELEQFVKEHGMTETLSMLIAIRCSSLVYFDGEVKMSTFAESIRAEKLMLTLLSLKIEGSSIDNTNESNLFQEIKVVGTEQKKDDCAFLIRLKQRSTSLFSKDL